MTLRNLQKYYTGEIEEVDDNASDDKLFKYKTKIMEKAKAKAPQLEQPSIPHLNIKVSL